MTTLQNTLSKKREPTLSCGTYLYTLFSPPGSGTIRFFWWNDLTLLEQSDFEQYDRLPNLFVFYLAFEWYVFMSKSPNNTIEWSQWK